MRKLARLLSSLSALCGALTLLRPKKWLALPLMAPKFVVGGISPFSFAAGVLGAGLGVLRRDRRAFVTGVLGALIAARHVSRVTAPHPGFEKAFGEGWASGIEPGLKTRMLAKRYTPIPANPPVVPCQQDLEFGIHVETGDPLLADLYQPPAGVAPSGLAIVYLHGSAWHMLDKDAGTRRFFRHLACQGHVIMDVAYTLAPKAQMQAMLADVKRAVAWMKQNAVHYGVDPDRVILMGGSAGGHLALLAAYTADHPELQPPDVQSDTSVRAVVSYYGLPDLEASQMYFRDRFGEMPPWAVGLLESGLRRVEEPMRRRRLIPSYGRSASPLRYIPNLLGGEPEEVPGLYRLASPVNHVGPHCPPTLQLQGTHDAGGMQPDVVRLHQALTEAGVLSVCVELPDTEHAFDVVLPRWSPAAQAATYDTERFLALML